ncbi:MAG: hypothetical protein IT436_18815 [Phycisphaerales bacterium]|nr:hypothetical protein [Phycisphaerales bacterium]
MVAAGAAVWWAAPARADVAFEVVNNRLATAFEDDATGEYIHDVRVFSGELGETVPGFSDEPGFFALEHTLSAGSTLTFDIRKAFRTWDGSDFDQVGPETMTLERPDGLFSITTPMTDPISPLAGWTTPGFPSDGDFDYHPNYFLNPSTAEGIYLLEMQFRTSMAGVEGSLPFWIVFNSGQDPAELNRAVDYVNQYILPAPGSAGLIALAGPVLHRRRR